MSSVTLELNPQSIPLTEKIFEAVKKNRNFDCLNPSVNEFFYDDTWPMQELYYIQTTLVFTQAGLVGFYSIASDSLQVKPPDGEEVDRFKKRFKYFPALKVQWLGVNTSQQRQGIGRLLMEQIVSKAYLLNDTHGTGCRFVTLDAQYDFREPDNAALNPYAFYLKFGFNFCDQGSANGGLKRFNAAKDAYVKGKTAGVNLFGSVSMYFDIFKLQNVL